MTDMEKIIRGLKGLECCIDPLKAHCFECQYYPCYDQDTTSEKVIAAALELLKEHEPRVLRLSEINKYDFVWCEHNLMGKLYPAIVADCNNVTCHEFFVKNYIFEVTRFMPEDMHYGRTWRCWSSKPTDEQRKAEKWE